MRIKQKITGHRGFTLAEMMVVMLILSVVMAAFAPIMTRRNKADLSNASPWKIVTAGENHIYYTNSIAPDSKSVAQIGAKLEQSDLNTNNINSRLLIATNSQAQNAISFGWRQNSSPAFTKLGDLRVTADSIFLGTPPAGNTGTNNTALGHNALSANTSGSSNTAIGSSALASSNTGSNNIALGDSALMSNTSGNNNVAIGYKSIANTANNNANTGSNNTAIGYQSLYNNSTGSYNVAVGYKTLYSNTSGFANLAIGGGHKPGVQFSTDSNTPLYANTTGYGNIAIGNGYAVDGWNRYAPMKSNTTGYENIAIGTDSLSSNTTGHSNIAIGNSSQSNINTGSSNITLGNGIMTFNVSNANNNIAIGNGSMSGAASGYTGTAPVEYNIAIGNSALSNVVGNSGAKYNVALGVLALQSVGKNSESNIAIGRQAMRYGHSSDNIAIGRQAMYTSSVITGGNNIAVGASTLQNLTEGANNIAIGPGTLNSLTSGTVNVAIGLNPLHDLTTGSNNVAIGDGACYYVSSGSNKTCIGKWSGVGMSSALQTSNAYAAFLGGGIPWWESGDHGSVTYIGGTSIFNNGAAVLEVHNPDYVKTAEPSFEQGWGTHISNCDSDECRRSKPSSTVVINGNLVVKGYVYSRVLDFSSTNSNDSTCLLGIRSAKDDDLVRCAHKLLPTDHISSDITGALNGFSSAKSFGAQGANINMSDRRLKNIQGANNEGLEKIKQLKVYNFTFKNDAKKLPHTGVIAQDLQKIFPNSVTKGEDGYLRIRWDEMFFSMVNSIKELAAKVTGLEDRLTKLEKENQELKARLTALENKLK